MDAVFIVLMGVGGFLMYEAYKNPSPDPLTKAIGVLNGTSTTSTSASGPLNASLDAGALTFPTTP